MRIIIFLLLALGSWTAGATSLNFPPVGDALALFNQGTLRIQGNVQDFTIEVRDADLRLVARESTTTGVVNVPLPVGSYTVLITRNGVQFPPLQATIVRNEVTLFTMDLNRVGSRRRVRAPDPTADVQTDSTAATPSVVTNVPVGRPIPEYLNPVLERRTSGRTWRRTALVVGTAVTGVVLVTVLSNVSFGGGTTSTGLPPPPGRP